MSLPDDSIFLEDMLDHARYAVGFTAGRVREEIHRDRQLAFAIVRALEIVGEAAGRVSPELRNEHGDVPWRQIVGMRNVLIHGYTRVDYDLLWEITTERLPPLIDQLQAILEALSTDEQ